jgi:hypothetical protein
MRLLAETASLVDDRPCLRQQAVPVLRSSTLDWQGASWVAGPNKNMVVVLQMPSHASWHFVSHTPLLFYKLGLDRCTSILPCSRLGKHADVDATFPRNECSCAAVVSPWQIQPSALSKVRSWPHLNAGLAWLGLAWPLSTETAILMWSSCLKVAGMPGLDTNVSCVWGVKVAGGDDLPDGSVYSILFRTPIILYYKYNPTCR